ncbi:GNAT family N-acetyltransferase [Streptomyces sp. SID3343]|nr:GNAT family N-acetyltransferase [Streptomyces sp. SID3343]
MLLALQGSRIERRDRYLVVRTPDNPTFHWGNFILLPGAPAAGTVQPWVRAFHREFPDAGHIALGVDGVDGAAGDPAELATADLTAATNTVMTASEVRPPARPNLRADVRMLAGDEDWRQALALKSAANEDFPPAAHREFARRKLAAMRTLQDGGFGGWFGAFDEGRMVAGLGLFTDGSGLARYQNVATHPDHRNRGLAGTLVHAAAAHAVAHFGARRFVMVADPDYVAIRLYRALGFTDAEKQIQLEPPGRS